MPHIITTTQMQQKIGHVSDTVRQGAYIVTNRGEAKMVILPYYDGCDEAVEDYMEDYEILKNKEKLQKEMHESMKSGRSDFSI